jgi:hypothetical protein
VSLAFCWANFDDDSRSGWYVVPAGQFKTFTLKAVVYHLTRLDFGYYAKGGGKVWAGKASDDRALNVIINPRKAFAGRRNDPISGGQKVYFKHLTLKENDSGEHGYATITLK